MAKKYKERNAAIAKIKDKINEYPHNSNPYWISNDDYIVRGLREAIEIIDEYTPTADVQEVVRCKDCNKFCPYLSFCADNCIGSFGHCQITHMNVSLDFYCGYGEKKDKE